MNSIKVLLSLFLLVAIIFSFSAYTHHLLAVSAEEIEKQISLVENSAKKGNWEDAKNGLMRMEKDWNKTEKTWTILLDHIEIDNISVSIKRMGGYIEEKQTPLALTEATVLRQYIKHIPKKETLNLENIF